MDSPLQRKGPLGWRELKVDADPAEDIEQTVYARPLSRTMAPSMSMEDASLGSSAHDDQESAAKLPSRSLYDDYAPPTNSNATMGGVPGDLKLTPVRGLGAEEPMAADGWIRVFGFGSRQDHAAIVAHFRTLGDIRVWEEGTGNWLDICYLTKWTAQKALSRNGMLLPGTHIMLGVTLPPPTEHYHAPHAPHAHDGNHNAMGQSPRPGSRGAGVFAAPSPTSQAESPWGPGTPGKARSVGHETALTRFMRYALGWGST
jgi:hypothetical protein